MICFRSTLAVWTSAPLLPCPRIAAPVTATMITRPARLIQRCFRLSFMTLRPPQTFALGLWFLGESLERIRPDPPNSYDAVEVRVQARVSAEFAAMLARRVMRSHAPCSYRKGG